MDKKVTEEKIGSSFRKIVKSDTKIKNAYLLVYSEKLNLNINIAEGYTGTLPASPDQANHLASVGKLFTATLIGMLYERGLLAFGDRIAKYLDADLMNGLHVYKGKEYSGEITIKQLLNQTSGLNEVFFPLLKKMINDPGLDITVREALQWGKSNLKPLFEPGRKHFYSDTNYLLLGLVIESITQKPFHVVMHEMIFDPLKMENSYINGFSLPKAEPLLPSAHIYLYNTNFTDNKQVAQIDYAGGGVIAPLSEYLIFMKALVNHRLVRGDTLDRMIHDDVRMGFPVLGFRYGYSVWKPTAIPVLMPRKFYCWGCVGSTGAFMFYHPQTESYIIGTFNDQSYTSRALRFMFMKIVNVLLKYQ